ncbi:hypothetical protein [Actinomadura rubrisoli]|uniref:Uncharacterized protein n=1 Tax=Actinomadura rubrisoli TaxID=2530368 RepID=A0A4V2YVD2_9ACTN|nr:hypothetical protein [Actinomadura rubrisoli]TDD81117.1 hypothetical protein E1298_24655 [Actinomadura rubrisoli]
MAHDVEDQNARRGIRMAAVMAIGSSIMLAVTAALERALGADEAGRLTFVVAGCGAVGALGGLGVGLWIRNRNRSRG